MGILILLILSLALRLILAPLGFHIDIFSNAGWGQWIYMHGPMGFYENSTWIYSWPTQPPFVSLIYGFDNWLYVFLLETFRSIGNNIVAYRLAPGHMVWWFNFTKWFDISKTSDEAVFSTGYLISIKIMPILADLGIAGLIFKIAKKIKGIKYPIIWPAIYLFSPFSWYLSALWGQYDQLGFLPVLISFILLSQKKLHWLTPFLLAVGVALKPTSLILVPFFIYIYLKNKPSKLNFIIAFVLIAAFFVETTKVFTDQNLFTFVRYDLYPKIFLKAASRLSANAFNLWRLFMSYPNQTQDAKFIFIPAYIWSLGFYTLFNILALKKIKEINLENTIKGVFIISAGSWIFMTNMLDRYLFAGIVSGLIICLFNRKIFKYWLVMSLIFALNLFNQWWFPDSFHYVKQIMTWNGGFVTMIFALTNIGIFLRIISLI